MSLSDRLKTVDRRPGRSEGCTVCRWLQQLPDHDQTEFHAWVDAGLSTTSLHEACKAEGLPVGVSTLRLHLRNCRESV